MQKNIEIDVKGKCPNLKTVIKIHFNIERIDDCSEEAKELLRKIYKDIVALHKLEGISVVVKQVEKTNLGELRAKAIATFKMFYKSYDLGEYSVSNKDTQITEKQALLMLDETLLRKYFECSEWYAKHKILFEYCSTDIQNRLNQKVVEKKKDYQDTWSQTYYNKLSDDNRLGYEKHLISLGFVKKRAGSGQIYYVKPTEK